MQEMSLENDLKNLSLGKITILDLKNLNKRGAYPIIRAGNILGFCDNDGVPLVMY